MSIKRGFSLIEVLVFVTILSLFLIVAASIITTSIRQNTAKINFLKATHYNQQLLEWIRSEKETDWSTFVSRGSAIGTFYCFTSDVPTWSIASCAYDLGGLFKRYAVIKTVGSPVTQVEVAIGTDWQEGGNTNTTKLHTVFSIWEE